MKRKMLAFSFLLVTIFSLKAQDYELFYKYWTYRERFYQKYVRIDWEGDGIGEFVDWEEPSNSPNFTRRGLYTKAGFSIPVDRVLPWWKDSSVLSGNTLKCDLQPANVRHSGTISGAPNVIEVVDYGGDPVYRLGNYLALLATEYKLLLNNNQTQRAQKTLEELYLALQAARRLDMTANRWLERQMTCPVTPPVVNFTGYTGLMLREDAPYDFWEEYRTPTVAGNPAYSGYGAIVGQQVACGIETAHPDTFGIASNVAPTQHEYDLRQGYTTLSQDQIIGLLFGLRFITKLIPDNTMFNGNNVKHMAGEMAMNILNTVQPNITRSMIIPLCPPFAVQNHYGGETAGYIYPMTLSCLKIARESGAYPVPVLPVLPNDPVFWGAFYNFYMKLLAPKDIHYNFVLGMRVAITSELAPLWEVEGMNRQAMGYADSFYPLAAAVLYGQSASSISNDFKVKMNRELGVAPCNSPRRYKKDYYPHPRWRSSMKWDRPWVSNGIDSNKDYGRFNGLDYMLAYNLYHLLYNSRKAYYDVGAPENNITFPTTEDHMVEYPYKLPGGGYLEIGSDTSPTRVFGNTIVSEAIVNGEVTTHDQKITHGYAIHKARESITMQVGFNAKAGGVYKATIEDPYCKWDVNTFLRSTDTKNTTKTKKDKLIEIKETVLAIYPNPANLKSTLQLNLIEANSIQVFLYSTTGQNIKELLPLQELKKGEHKLKIELPQVTTGVYFVKAVFKNKVLTKQIIIEN